MLFIKRGENIVKVTYDGLTWEPYDIVLENENWRWWIYEEYKEQAAESFIEQTLHSPYNNGSAKAQEKQRNDLARYVQTLQDIKNGIKVSKKLANIYIVDSDSPLAYYGEGWITWYCFGYAFLDKYGNEVDLGLFETRDQLFATLKQYYDQEVEEGRLTQAEADASYNQLAHSVRRPDEVPLFEKLAHPYTLFEYSYEVY
jgi:hypothetical protein